MQSREFKEIKQKLILDTGIDETVVDVIEMPQGSFETAVIQNSNIK